MDKAGRSNCFLFITLDDFDFVGISHGYSIGLQFCKRLSQRIKFMKMKTTLLKKCSQIVRSGYFILTKGKNRF